MRYSDFKIVENASTEVGAENDPRGPDQRNDPDASTGLEAGPPYPQEDTEAVRALQTKLQSLGYSVGTTGIDGKYGPRTTAAVRTYKADFDVSGDGLSISADEITAMQSAERKENPTPVPGNTVDGPAGGDGGERGTDSGSIRYENQGKIRSGGLDSRLEAILQSTAEEVGVVVHVSSGGQMSMDAYNRAPGRKTNDGRRSTTYYLNGRAVRKGSTRHDNGLAADIQISSGGRKARLDTPLMNSFIEAFFRHRGAGGGSGHRGYMGVETIHVDIHTNRSRHWHATRGFVAAMQRGLAQQGTA
jgi:peptidoglycan hydrolase-like protein with peptidoglycan-binding domain